jgi:hypothetical protein
VLCHLGAGSPTSSKPGLITEAILPQSVVDELLNCHTLLTTAVWDYCEALVQYVFGTKTGNQYADRITDALRESENGFLTGDDTGRRFGGHRTHERDLAVTRRGARARGQSSLSSCSFLAGGRAEEIPIVSPNGVQWQILFCVL